MEVNSYRLTDKAAARTPAESRAFAAATRLRADAEAARAQAGEERFISTPADLKNLGDFRQQKLTVMSQKDGVVHGFVQNDANQGIQYQLSRSIAAGMMGGMAGGLLQASGLEIITRTTVGGDSIVRVESLGIEACGLMNYSEYQLPR